MSSDWKDASKVVSWVRMYRIDDKMENITGKLDIVKSRKNSSMVVLFTEKVFWLSQYVKLKVPASM